MSAITSGEERPDVDVVVIGAGVNGSGVARDCALRGLRVHVFERNDIAFGASGNSSGMIHGGPRYLTYDPDVTYTSCLDSGHIQHIAPHLLFRIPFLMPVHKERRTAAIALTLLDAFFELYDRYQPLKHGKPHVRLTAEQLTELEPGLAGQTVGGISFDEWGIDGSRLCTANIVDTVERGGRVSTHTTVTGVLQKANGEVRGVRFKQRLTGETGQVTARLVVNATGAWAPLTAQLAGLGQEHARVRPGKGVHVFFDRRLTNYAIIARAIDGRQVFVEPWQNMTVIGTTDDDFYGDLDHVVATSDECRYLLQAVGRVFPAIHQARAIGSWAAVRPTLYEWGKAEDALSREHQIVDHAPHGLDGYYSMIGGKLASYRIFSEQMTDVLCERLGVRARCSTHVSPLPGGEEAVDPLVLASDARITGVAAQRLEYRHGARARSIVARIQRRPTEAHVVCPCEPVTEAEIRHSVQCEFAQTVEDVSRRTRLGLGACGGMRCALRCGAIVAQMRDLAPSDGQRMAIEFLNGAQARRVCALGPTQARQEALSMIALASELGVSPGAESGGEPGAG